MNLEKIAVTSWCNKRPIPVFIIACYCVLKCAMFVKYGAGIFDLMRTGAITIPMFALYLSPGLFLGIAAILLLLKKESSINFFWAAFVVAIAAIFLLSKNNPFIVSFTLTLRIEEIALLFGTIIYGYHLKSAGYFGADKQTSINSP